MYNYFAHYLERRFWSGFQNKLEQVQPLKGTISRYSEVITDGTLISLLIIPPTQQTNEFQSIMLYAKIQRIKESILSYLMSHLWNWARHTHLWKSEEWPLQEGKSSDESQGALWGHWDILYLESSRAHEHTYTWRTHWHWHLSLVISGVGRWLRQSPACLVSMQS